MRPETKYRLNNLVRRERLRYSASLIFCVLGFIAFGSFWLEPWKAGAPQVVSVISYYGNEGSGYREANDGISRAIVKLTDGSEGLVALPQPRSLAVGERIIVKQETSKIFGRRRFIFLGRAK